MKDFENFIESLDLDDYNTIQIAANQSMNNMNKLKESDRAYFIALELLHRYHIWINEA